MITPEHRAFLNGSAITDAVIEAVGIESTEDGINFPWRSPDGTTVIQFRPDRPEGGPKYRWPAETPLILNQIRDNGSPVILLVEGTKQPLAAASWAPSDYAIYGMAGCWGWSKCDLSFVADREVIAVFDGDVASNRHVWEAADRLKDMIEGEGGRVRFFTIPGNPSDREGLDDVLARRDEADRMAWIRRRVTQAGPRLPKKPPMSSNSIYFDQSGLKVKTLAKEVYERYPMLLSQENKPAIYTKGAFRRNTTAFTGVIAEILGELYRPFHRAAAEEFISGMLYQEGKILPERPSEPLLNMSNGMLDLVTGKLYPHDPKYRSAVQIPVEWDPEATCPVYEGWLIDSIGADQMDDLEETTSTMLDPSRTPTKAVFLFGPSRSGKSTYLRLMSQVAGSDNVSAITLHQLVEDQFAAADIYGKMLNAAADLSAAHVDDISLFKMLTGEDMIRGNRKYGGRFFFTNTALFAFSANELPTVGESSRAYSERIKPFKFDKSFAGRENPEIEAKMKEELSGIVRRWVAAWQRMNARGGYQATADAIQYEFEVRSDRVRQWVAERCEITTHHPDGREVVPGMVLPADQVTGKRDAAQAFNRWAEDVGAKKISERKVLDRLTGVPGVVEVRRADNKNAALNIRIKPDLEEDNTNPFALFGGPEDEEGGQEPSEGGPKVTPDHRGTGRNGEESDPKVTPVWDTNDHHTPSDLGSVGSVGKSPIKSCTEKSNAEKSLGENGFKSHTTHTQGEINEREEEMTMPLTSGFTASEIVPTQREDQNGKTHSGVGNAHHPLGSHTGGTAPTPATVTVFDLETAQAEELYRRRDFVRLGATATGDEPPALSTNGYELARAVQSATWAAGHNISAFDLQALGRWHGLNLAALRDRVIDTDLWARLIHPPTSGKDGVAKMPTGFYGLDATAERFGVVGKTHDLKALAKKHGGMDKIPTDDPEFRAYLVGDIEATRALVAAMLPTWSPYVAREMNVGLITAQMSLNGFRVDTEELGRTLEEQAARKERNLEELSSLTGMPLDAKSPLATKAGKEALEEAFCAAGLRPDALPRTGKTGALSTGREDMSELLAKVRKHGGNERVERIITLVMDIVGERTVYQTAESCRVGDRVHPTIRPLQASGRWSVTSPGLTVYGKRQGRHVERRIFLPDPGEVLLCFDADQVDARGVAAHSGDEGYLSIFREGRDLHGEVALAVYADLAMRETSKAISHGWNYGESINRMVLNGVDRDLAIQFDRMMRQKYPKLVQWQSDIRAQGASGALLDNGFGRPMRPDPQFAYTQAPALVGQGCTRDIIAEGLLRMPTEVWPMLRVLVHDEIVMSVPKDSVEDVKRVVLEAMQFDLADVTGGKLASCPITAGCSKPGETWAACYDK